MGCVNPRRTPAMPGAARVVRTARYGTWHHSFTPRKCYVPFKGEFATPTSTRSNRHTIFRQKRTR